MPQISELMALALAALTGILSGFGIGGGTLLIIVLVFFFSSSQSAAQAINLTYFIPTAGASLLFHGTGGRLDRSAIIWSGCFGVIFSAVSSYIAPYIDTAAIKCVFGAILIYVGISEIFVKAQPRP